MDRTGQDGSTSEEVRQYAIANELQYINRNDHIIIPIEVTDWIIEVDVRFYPPIGGYPAVITEDKNREYYITFGTEGWFEIETRVRYAAPGSPWLEKGKYQVALRDAITGDPIFEQAPAIIATGEITGRLNTSTGSAKVPVAITVHQDGKPDMSYLKTITIIKN